MTAFRVPNFREVATAFFALSSVIPSVVADLASTSTLAETPSWALKSVMYMTLSNKSNYQYSIFPLTTAEGLNNSAEFRENIDFSGPITMVNESTFDLYQASSTGIAFLSCDPTTDGPDPSTMLNSIMDTKPLAIVMYSLGHGICDLSGSNLSYTRIFTMASGGFAHSATLMISSAKSTVAAQVSGKSNDKTVSNTTKKSKNNATTIAMGLLYGVTALISVTFLLIVVTGAVRVHRFPERYGPGIRWGGISRQGRARGLARAVLDTMPVIKFGEPEPSGKLDPKHDLESGSMTQVPPAAVVRDTVELREVQRAVSGEPVAGAQSQHNEEEGEHLGCSICTEDFQVGEDVRVLSCSHKFHPACIDPWLMDISSTCPLCRTDFNSGNNNGNNNDQSIETAVIEDSGRYPETPFQRAVRDLQRLRPTLTREECVRQISRVRRLTPFAARHRSRNMAAAATETNGADRVGEGQTVVDDSVNQEQPGSASERAENTDRAQHNRMERLRERMRIHRGGNDGGQR